MLDLIVILSSELCVVAHACFSYIVFVSTINACFIITFSVGFLCSNVSYVLSLSILKNWVLLVLFAIISNVFEIQDWECCVLDLVEILSSLFCLDVDVLFFLNCSCF